MAVLVKREAALQEQARSLKSEMDAVLRTMGELQAIIREMQAVPKRKPPAKRTVTPAAPPTAEQLKEAATMTCATLGTPAPAANTDTVAA